MNQGESLAQTFLIPQYAENTNVAGGGAHGSNPNAFYDDGLKPLDNLQHVQNMTSDYYRKVADLKSFMQEMHNNFGIDARVPDYSKGELGIKVNELYNKALADIMAQGNLLQNSHATMSNLVNQHARFMTNPNQMPVDEMTLGKNYTFNAPSEFVKEVNDQMDNAHYGEDYQGAQSIYSNAVTHLRKLQKENPDLASVYEDDIKALTPPRKGIFRPIKQSAYEYRAGRRQRNAEIMLKKLANIKNGLVDFEPTTKVAPSGELYETNKDFSNFKYGQKVISEIRRDPKTGDQKIIFQDGSSQQMPADVMQLAQGLGAGQNLGYDQEDLQNYIVEHKLEGDLGKLNENKLLPTQEEQLGIRKGQEARRTAKLTLVKPIHDAVKAQLANAAKPRFFGTEETSLDLGNGTNIEFSRHTDGSYSIQPKELFKIIGIPQLKNGKQDAVKAKAIASKFQNKSLDVIVKNLLNTIPIEDFQSIYDALNIPLPKEIQQSNSPERAPAAQPSASGLAPGSLD
jgi:hypothetical protein